MCWILLFKNFVGSLTRNTTSNLYNRCSVILNSQLAKDKDKAIFICMGKDYDFNYLGKGRYTIYKKFVDIIKVYKTYYTVV